MYIRTIKDDGCNTNIVPCRPIKQNKMTLELAKRMCVAKKSKTYLIGISSKVIPNGKLQIGLHTYSSNFG